MTNPRVEGGDARFDGDNDFLGAQHNRQITDGLELTRNCIADFGVVLGVREAVTRGSHDDWPADMFELGAYPPRPRLPLVIE